MRSNERALDKNFLVREFSGLRLVSAWVKSV